MNEQEQGETPGEVAPAEREVPVGFGWVVELVRRHPKWKGPTTGAIVLWLVLLVGGGISVFTITKSQEAVARVHNISACTLRSYLTSVRTRQQATADDTTLSAPARKRARDSLKGIDVLIGSQVTTPKNFDCPKLLRELARDRPKVRVK